MSTELNFPSDFVWGTATASYQIEGAAQEEGRSPSIWDTFSRTPGKVINGDSGDVACDHYHRYVDDVRLMKSLNIAAYRFSTAWPRIIPAGRGQLNEVGLDFYSRLVDELLEAGITPFLTLYHWDLPQSLEDEGGWLRRGIHEDFAAYTDATTRALGDRVKHWITINEPWCIAWLGYGSGHHAPGKIATTPAMPLMAAHNVNLAHGAAVQVIRANVPGAIVGIAPNTSPTLPVSDRAEDIDAARCHDGFYNRWFMDPVLKGSYPEDMVKDYSPYVPEIHPGDMELANQPLDFLAFNYYNGALVGASDTEAWPGLKFRNHVRGDEFTDMGWEVYPQGLYEILITLNERYGLPLYITENGAAYADVIAPDGEVHDADRVSFLERHFEQAQKAIEAGVPLKGYFVWSLMDNYEWAFGYTKRFGITYVDYATQQRIVKDSGKLLAKIAAR